MILKSKVYILWILSIFSELKLYNYTLLPAFPQDMLLECLEQVDSVLKTNLLHIGSVPSKDNHPTDPLYGAPRPEDSTPTDVDMVF